MSKTAPPVNPRLALLLAAAVMLFLRWFVPFGGAILYPFTLLATWVHEMGHGLTALALGGTFPSLDIFVNASGLAHTAVSGHWRQGLVAAGGLVAPAAVGASILALSRGPRRVQVVLWALGGLMLLSLVCWVRSVVGWVSIGLLTAALGALTLRGSPRERIVASQFVGLLLALDLWARLGYFFVPSAVIDGTERASDIAHVASAFGGPQLVWGLLLAGVSFALIAAGLLLAWRPPRTALATRAPARALGRGELVARTGARVGRSRVMTSASRALEPETDEEERLRARRL